MSSGVRFFAEDIDFRVREEARKFIRRRLSLRSWMGNGGTPFSIDEGEGEQGLAVRLRRHRDHEHPSCLWYPTGESSYL